MTISVYESNNRLWQNNSEDELWFLCKGTWSECVSVSVPEVCTRLWGYTETEQAIKRTMLILWNVTKKLPETFLFPNPCWLLDCYYTNFCQHASETFVFNFFFFFFFSVGHFSRAHYCHTDNQFTAQTCVQARRDASGPGRLFGYSCLHLKHALMTWTRLHWCNEKSVYYVCLSANERRVVR